MARYLKAKWDPISGPVGAYTGGPWKIVHHKTEGATLAGARSAFRSNKSDPHFTVHPLGVNQHIDTAVASRSLRNPAGGVQTGRDSAIQIEVVGFSGHSCADATLNHLIDLILWIQTTHDIPWRWPEGRPPLDSTTGYGERTGERHSNVWDTIAGHYGHSQVPENSHWDPAYTDREWWILNARCNPAFDNPAHVSPPAPYATEEDDVLRKLVEMPPANGFGLATKFVDFGREVAPAGAPCVSGPDPDSGGDWDNNTIGAVARARPKGTGLQVSVDGVKVGAVAYLWVPAS